MTEETSTSQVPLLDLAPKLKRPLSLWNPLDYLLLLYWVFYFPQAIRWYVETYCEPAPESERLTWEQRWQLMRSSPRKLQLAIMGLLLEIAVPILILFGLESFGISIHWFLLAFGVTFGAAFGLAFGIVRGVEFGVARGVELSVAWSLANDVALDMANDVAFGLAGGLTGGVMLGLAGGVVARDTAFGLVFGVARDTAFGVAFGLAGGLAFGIGRGVAGGLAFEAAFGLTLGVATFHPEDLLFSIYKIPRISPIIWAGIDKQLIQWLHLDWQKGLLNCNQYLRYSLQFISVDRAINKSLVSIQDNDLTSRIAEISDLIWDQKVLRYSSASLTSALKLEFIENIFWLPNKAWFASHWDANRDLRFDTNAHTVAAGFWYLHEASEAKEVDETISNLTKAVEVFENLRQIRHGEEMYRLASNLCNFSKPKDLEGLLNLPPTYFPPDPSEKDPTLTVLSTSTIHFFLTSPFIQVNSSFEPVAELIQTGIPTFDLLRPQTWDLISNLLIALLEVQDINRNKSRTSRSFALNRALGQVAEALKTIDNLPPEVSRVEKPILKDIAIRWRDILLSEASETGQIEIDKPIANPYTIGDPVVGDRFIGREDILRQLEELWFINTSPQSVILYGHRRMGKTSILRNATTKVNTEVRVAYVNLLSVSSASNGITDILMAICDALEEVTEIPVPSNNDLLQFPENTFRRYLEQVTKTFTGKGLIIALDEFEKIEELIDAGKLSKDFLGFLRGMVQMSSKLAFAFAGLHTLQEMNADYFQPFYASFIPISVAFLNRDATHQVLANPDPEFLLEYEPAALDHIYDLTNGQPYLTQLIGFQLVRMFNDYVFEQGKPRDRTFTIYDVRTICSGENFFTTGINYFNGVWQQAAEGATHQQDILKALAPHPQGLTESELISQINLPSETLQAALKTLKDHDVIRVQKINEMVNWAIAVELFRNWVVKYKLNSVDS